MKKHQLKNQKISFDFTWSSLIVYMTTNSNGSSHIHLEIALILIVLVSQYLVLLIYAHKSYDPLEVLCSIKAVRITYKNVKPLAHSKMSL